MTFPNNPIQRTYNRYQPVGQIGTLAQFDNNTFYYDVAEAGLALKPSWGVYLDEAVGATQGMWIVPTEGLDNTNLVTHLVSFEVGDLNVPLIPPEGNNTSEIEFPAGTVDVKALANGSMFVPFGADILRGQQLQWDPGTQTFIPYVNASPADLLIIALQAGTDGDIGAVRINRVGYTAQP